MMANSFSLAFVLADENGIMGSKEENCLERCGVSLRHPDHRPGDGPRLRPCKPENFLTPAPALHRAGTTEVQKCHYQP